MTIQKQRPTKRGCCRCPGMTKHQSGLFHRDWSTLPAMDCKRCSPLNLLHLYSIVLLGKRRACGSGSSLLRRVTTQRHLTQKGTRLRQVGAPLPLPPSNLVPLRIRCPLTLFTIFFLCPAVPCSIPTIPGCRKCKRISHGGRMNLPLMYVDGSG